MFHADGFTKENGNGKRKRSLGCARDDETGKRLFPFLFNLLRKPTPPRCARQPLPREGARVDTPSFLWKEGECRLTDFPRRRLTIRECRFPALSFRAKARNLFRLRSGKGCEDSGEREAPCSQRIGRTVFHADGFTKENGNGKRKRSLGCARDDETGKRLFPFLFNLLRKPTPPRCARQPLPREGARVDNSLLPMEKAAKRGWLYPRHKAFFLGCQYPFFLSTSFMSLSPWAKATKFIWRRLVSLSQKSGTMEAMCGVMMTLSICQKG